MRRRRRSRHPHFVAAAVAAADWVTTPLAIIRGIGRWFFRVPLRVGLAKAGIGRNIDKYLEKCTAYGIQTDDLYYKEVGVVRVDPSV